MKSVDKLLKSLRSSRLGEIVERAQEMGDFGDRLRRHIDTELADHIHAVNAGDDGELVVVCRSQAWAAKLRFAETEVLAAARAAGFAATRYRVKVRAE